MCVDRTGEKLLIPQQHLEPIKVTTSSLLANDLFLPWDVDDPRPRLQAFLNDNGLAGHVMESMYSYDRIIIPTVDLAIVVPLVHWLGAGVLKEMLETQSLSFVRFTGTLGYVGNGVGLATFEIHPDEKTAEPWWMKAARCSPAEAVVLQLTNRLTGLKEGLVDMIGRLVETCTVDTALPQFTQKVEEETYRDIPGSDILRTLFSIRNKNLKNLRLVQDYAWKRWPAWAGS